MILPDLTQYRLHRTVTDAELDGVAVPGLCAEFYRRDDGGRTATVGRYWHSGRELLMAWGYVDEEHCRYSALRGEDGTWLSATAGCPAVRVLRDLTHPDAPVTGFAVRDPHGRWITWGSLPGVAVDAPDSCPPIGP